MKRYSRSLAALTPLVAVAMAGMGLLVGGCGSGGRTISSGAVAGSRAETGTATLQVQWPTRKTASKLIPVASNTILVDITYRGKIIASQTLKRSDAVTTNGVLTSTASFPSLPVGQLGVVVYAIPDATVSSTATPPTDAQAEGSGVINIMAGKTTTLTVTLASTITELDIVPSATGTTNLLTDNGGNQFDYLTIGQTHTFDVQALDQNGNTVLLATGANTTVQWSSGNASVLKVTPHTADNGVDITGVASGDTTLNVTETESGFQASLPVSVRGPLAAVHITSIAPVLYKNGIMFFEYQGVDSGGFLLPKAAVPSATWSSSTPTIAVIDASTGQCTGVSAGPGMSNSATSNITLSAGGFQDTQVVTVYGIATGMSTARFSPTLVALAPNISQRFLSWTSPFNVPAGVTYSIVIPDGASGSFGTLDQRSGQGYCIYTTPAVKPTVTSGGTTVTVTTITLHPSNGAADAVVALQ